MRKVFLFLIMMMCLSVSTGFAQEADTVVTESDQEETDVDVKVENVESDVPDEKVEEEGKDEAEEASVEEEEQGAQEKKDEAQDDPDDLMDKYYKRKTSPKRTMDRRIGIDGSVKSEFGQTIDSKPDPGYVRDERLFEDRRYNVDGSLSSSEDDYNPRDRSRDVRRKPDGTRIIR